MSPLPTRQIANALSAKGFRELQTHHQKFFLYVDGRRTHIYTHISHGAREYSDGLLAKMARQIKLSRKQFSAFVNCPLTFENYMAILRQSDVLHEESAAGDDES